MAEFISASLRFARRHTALSKKISQRWRAVDNTVSNWTGGIFEPPAPDTNDYVFDQNNDFKTPSYCLLCSFFLHILCLDICRHNPTDFIFLLDGSRSVRPSNFILMKNYIKGFVDVVDDLGHENVQLGVVSCFV